MSEKGVLFLEIGLVKIFFINSPAGIVKYVSEYVYFLIKNIF